MSFRFRKSFKVGKNTRINLSKSGVGLSTGVKGARVSVNQKGTRSTLSAPGTGISYVTYKSHGSNKKNYNETNNTEDLNNYNFQENYMPKAKYYSIIPAIISFIFSLTMIPYGFIIINIFTLYRYSKFRTAQNKAHIIYNKALKEKEDKNKLEILYDAQSVDPNNILVNNALAIINYNQYENEEVIKAIERMNENELGNVNINLIYSLYLSALYENQCFEKIINFFEPLMEQDLNIKLAVAISYKNIGKVKRASEILATGPVNKRTYDDTVLRFKYELGLCFLELGQKQKALTQLKKVYEVDSSFMDIVKYAQKLDFALGEHVLKE